MNLDRILSVAISMNYSSGEERLRAVSLDVKIFWRLLDELHDGWVGEWVWWSTVDPHSQEGVQGLESRKERGWLLT